MPVLPSGKPLGKPQQYGAGEEKDQTPVRDGPSSQGAGSGGGAGALSREDRGCFFAPRSETAPTREDIHCCACLGCEACDRAEMPLPPGKPCARQGIDTGQYPQSAPCRTRPEKPHHDDEQHGDIGQALIHTETARFVAPCELQPEDQDKGTGRCARHQHRDQAG